MDTPTLAPEKALLHGIGLCVLAHPELVERAPEFKELSVYRVPTRWHRPADSQRRFRLGADEQSAPERVIGSPPERATGSPQCATQRVAAFLDVRFTGLQELVWVDEVLG